MAHPSPILADLIALGFRIPQQQVLGVRSQATTLDFTKGTLINFTVGAAFALTFAGLPADGNWFRAVLRITNGAAFALTWPGGINWAGGSAPVLSASGVDVVVLVIQNNGGVYTIDGSFVGKVV